MLLKNSEKYYGTISRLNHWLFGIAIIAMLAVGFYFNDMPRGDEKFYWLKMHVSAGGILFSLLIFRVLWSWFSTSPQPVKQDKKLMTLTKLIHGLLLLCILVMAITGPFLVWTRGADINVFGYFAIPGPFVEKMPELHEIVEVIHKVAAKVMFGALILHVLGALKHLFLDKDHVMSRMVKFLRR